MLLISTGGGVDVSTVTSPFALVLLISTGGGVDVSTVTSPFALVLLISTGGGVEVSTEISALLWVLLISTGGGVEVSTMTSVGTLVKFVYCTGCPGTRGLPVAGPEKVVALSVMTVTGGHSGQSWVAVRTLFVPVEVPGTTGKQVGHSLVTVSVEVGGTVAVTGGQVGQSSVTVWTGGTPGEVTLAGEVGVTSGHVGHGWVMVTVDPVPVVMTGTKVCGWQVGQSCVTVTEGTGPTVTGGQIGQRVVIVTWGQ